MASKRTRTVANLSEDLYPLPSPTTSRATPPRSLRQHPTRVTRSSSSASTSSPLLTRGASRVRPLLPEIHRRNLKRKAGEPRTTKRRRVEEVVVDEEEPNLDEEVHEQEDEQSGTPIETVDDHGGPTEEASGSHSHAASEEPESGLSSLSQTETLVSSQDSAFDVPTESSFTITDSSQATVDSEDTIVAELLSIESSSSSEIDASTTSPAPQAGPSGSRGTRATELKRALSIADGRADTLEHSDSSPEPQLESSEQVVAPYTSTASTIQSEPLSAYTCPICFCPPTNAVLTPCGHICCGSCLFIAVKTTADRAAQMTVPDNMARCPVCRAELKDWDGRGKGLIGLKIRTITSLA